MTKEYGLLFYLSGDFSESDVVSLRQVIISLEEQNKWSDRPPEFIDQTLYNPQRAGESLRTVGGFLCLSKPGAETDRDSERACYEDVARVVRALSAFSASTGCELELELGGNFVGDIAYGEPSKLITVGLLAEWRKALDRS